MTKLLHIIRRILWICMVGFMIAWHNVYHQDDKLRDDTNIKIVISEDDEDDGS
ncbi:MAG: hypothetical protein GY816_12180 [Cytophagales bacterium]|nr:hypothetical protein [Cytophagales bacterium]